MEPTQTTRLSTGIDELDHVLNGGLLPHRTYLLRGSPGAGKTLFGLHFLLAGADDEDTLFIALEEGGDDIHDNAASVGLDLSPVTILGMSPGAEFFAGDQTYDVFSPDETEWEPLTVEIAEQITSHNPDRVVLDPATQLRYLAPDDYQFRKQILSFIRFLREQDATVLLTSQAAEATTDEDLQFLCDGVIDLRATSSTRTLAVPKFRGSSSQDGRHAFRITDQGIEVYPEITPRRHGADFTPEPISSGVPEIDRLLHGGINRGTVTIIGGPTGVGKTTLGTHFMKEAASRGERSIIYLFEERQDTFLARSAAINVPVQEMLEQETLAIEEVEPLQRSADEFVHYVREEVEQRGSQIVMIDGIKGFSLSLHGEDDTLIRKLHSLGRYLKNMGVTVILVDETTSVTGEFEPTSSQLSYLADSIVFIRYLELEGELRKAIGVLKKRTSDFERTLRKFQITEDGLQIGDPLSNLRGILSGIPERTEPSMKHQEE